MMKEAFRNPGVPFPLTAELVPFTSDCQDYGFYT